MKFGAHVFIWQDRFNSDDLCRTLDSAADLQLSFLEIPIGDDIQFDVARIAAHAQARDLELVLSPGGDWPMHCDISLGNADHRQQGIDWHRRGIELTAQCGAVAYAGALYGHPGCVERRAPCDAEQQRTAQGLRTLAKYAAEHDVQLVLEPMSHFRSHVANTPRQINELMRLADHPNLFSLLDTYHMSTEVTDLAAAFEEMSPRLWGMHACENNRGAPGSGFLPWDSLIAATIRAGWSGYLGFESYNSTWRNGDFAFERGMFHNVCPNAEEFISKSKSFLEDRFRALG